MLPGAGVGATTGKYPRVLLATTHIQHYTPSYIHDSNQNNHIAVAAATACPATITAEEAPMPAGAKHVKYGAVLVQVAREVPAGGAVSALIVAAHAVSALQAST